MAATIVILFASSVFLFILLVAVLYHKNRTQGRHDEQTYEYSFPQTTPPALPSPRITTTDNPAYEKIIVTKDCVAYESSGFSQIYY